MTNKQKINEASAIFNRTAREVRNALKLLPSKYQNEGTALAYDAYTKLMEAAAKVKGE